MSEPERTPLGDKHVGEAVQQWGRLYDELGVFESVERDTEVDTAIEAVNRVLGIDSDAFAEAAMTYTAWSCSITPMQAAVLAFLGETPILHRATSYMIGFHQGVMAERARNADQEANDE